MENQKINQQFREDEIALAILELAETRAIARSSRFAGYGVEYCSPGEVSHLENGGSDSLPAKENRNGDNLPPGGDRNSGNGGNGFSPQSGNGSGDGKGHLTSKQ